MAPEHTLRSSTDRLASKQVAHEKLAQHAGDLEHRLVEAEDTATLCAGVARAKAAVPQAAPDAVAAQTL
eukprot:780705-Pyramimonas_sp.AAC.1